jgi:RNase H-fold protein (predicted Holliday junction resolvase)
MYNWSNLVGTHKQMRVCVCVADEVLEVFEATAAAESMAVAAVKASNTADGSAAEMRK